MGSAEACEAMAPGCGVIGGDLSVSETLTIAVTAFGDLEGRDAVLRSGARPGDVVAASGSLGLAAEGLALLFGLSDGDPVPPGELRNHPAVQAQLRPHPPVADGVLAALAGATAMLDVSDGLLLDASRLAAASGVGIDLDEPEHPLALAGGEDHALLATFPAGAALPGRVPGHRARPRGFEASPWLATPPPDARAGTPTRTGTVDSADAQLRFTGKPSLLRALAGL